MGKHTPPKGLSQLPGEVVGFGFIACIDRGSAQVEGSICGLYECRVGGLPGPCHIQEYSRITGEKMNKSANCACKAGDTDSE